MRGSPAISTAPRSFASSAAAAKARCTASRSVWPGPIRAWRCARRKSFRRRTLAAIAGRLARLDRAAPWTRATLALIGAHPGVRAEDLARRQGLEKAPFKSRVRRLKELGLTESLAVGYRLSPRGTAVLHADRPPAD